MSWRSASGNDGWRRKEAKKKKKKKRGEAVCNRKIGRHTRSMVSLFRLEFLIPFPTLTGFLPRSGYTRGNYPTMAKEDGTVESKKSNNIEKSPSPIPSSPLSSRRSPGEIFTNEDKDNPKLESRSQEVRFIPRAKKTPARRIYCVRGQILRGFCISLSVRWQASTIKGGLRPWARQGKSPRGLRWYWKLRQRRRFSQPANQPVSQSRYLRTRRVKFKLP